MPVVRGRTADIVIGSSAIFKRQTASQIIKAGYGMFCEEQSIEACTMSYIDVIKRFAAEYNIQRIEEAYERIATVYE
jgi:hypothetical protein